MSIPLIPFDPDAWVDAAPFAAHLAHLSDATGLPWQVAAAHAGLPQRTAERLLSGRRGLRLRRLPRRLAQRLLAIEPTDLLALGRLRVAAEPTIRRVAELVARGVPLHRLAEQLACTPDVVARLADGSPATVSAEVALRAKAAYETNDRESLRRVLHAA